MMYSTLLIQIANFADDNTPDTFAETIHTPLYSFENDV